jgi:TonB-linked SusC/RagA family outer membrane protein
MRNIIKYFLTTLCCFAFTLFSHANVSVRGTVVDANSKPIPGVRVTKAGELKGTFTNQDGEFSYTVDDLPAVFEFNSPGYSKGEITIQNEDQDKTVVLVLEPKESTQPLAYGDQTKESVSASVYTISGEELIMTRSTNIFIALQGRLPGLRITQKSGEPGNEAFDVQIRGYDSPNSTSVMYLVDGVERSIAGIDPHEVESITVLRDAAATAMYGMRASGGALLLKTKTGYNGKSKISVSFDQALQAPTRMPEMVSAYDYAKMYNQRVANDTLYQDAQSVASGGSGLDHSSTVFYTPYEIERYKNADMTEFYPVRNMVDEFTSDFSKLSRLNINFQGGTDMMKFFTSVGYMNQSGLFESETFDRYSYDASSKTNRFNFRTNMDIQLNKSLNAWIKVGGFMEKNNRPYIGSGEGWSYVLQKLYETPNNAHNDLTSDGEVLVKRDKLNYLTSESVYGMLNRTGSKLETTTRLGNTFGVRQNLDGITKGLSVMGQLTFDIWSKSTQNRSRTYEQWEVANLVDVNGADSLGYSKILETSNSTLSDAQGKFFYYLYNFRGAIDYQRKFGDKHSVSATLMGERQMMQQQAYLASNYIGMATRVNYAYDNKYFAELNGAYQGSEQYAKGNRFGFFPSLSAAWLISNESFMQDVSAVDFLKLRASAGQTGNGVFEYGDDYQYLYITTWNSDATENQLGNPNITWETSTKYNVGLDVELFNSLYLSADYFYHHNTDVIVTDIAILPDGMMGLQEDANLPPANLGESVNSGFELAIGYNKQINKDFAVAINGNVSVANNEVIDMAELAYDDTYAYAYRSKGYAYGYHWGYKTDGLFDSQAEIDGWADQSALGGLPIPGDIKYVDLTNDGIIDEKDKAPLAPKYANIHYGLNAQITYKGFDLSVFVNGMQNGNSYMSGFGNWSNRDNFTEYMKNAWTADNPTSDAYPRLGNNTTNYIKSDYWIKDASYIRLRNVELGFTLPQSISNKINAGAIRFYVNGLNLMTWDNLPNDDFDPELVSFSTTGYPIAKAYNFGVSVKF